MGPRNPRMTFVTTTATANYGMRKCPVERKSEGKTATAHTRDAIGPDGASLRALGQSNLRGSVAQGSRQFDASLFESLTLLFAVWRRVNKTAEWDDQHWAGRLAARHQYGVLGTDFGRSSRFIHHPQSTIDNPHAGLTPPKLLRGARSTIRWPCPNQPGPG